MSLIVAAVGKTRAVIAADSRGSSAAQEARDTVQKIFQFGNYTIVGSVGMVAVEKYSRWKKRYVQVKDAYIPARIEALSRE